MAGNRIGTDASGTTAIPNGAGIQIFNSAGNTIGGATAGAGNLISGNRVGVDISVSGASEDLVLGNQIGTDVLGTIALPNVIGIQVHRAGFTLFTNRRDNRRQVTGHR